MAMSVLFYQGVVVIMYYFHDQGGVQISGVLPCQLPGHHTANTIFIVIRLCGGKPQLQQKSYHPRTKSQNSSEHSIRVVNNSSSVSPKLLGPDHRII